MSAKYFCDKCGVEVESHQHYAVSFKNDSDFEIGLKHYISEDIYLCEEHRDAIIILIQVFLEQVLRKEVDVVYTREVVDI